MNFEVLGHLTNVEQKNGKNGLYTVVTFLTNKGKTIDVLYKGENVIELAKIENMSQCIFSLEYTLGKYSQLVLHDVKVA